MHLETHDVFASCLIPSNYPEIHFIIHDMIPVLTASGQYHRFSSSLQPTLHLARQVYSEEAPDLKTTYLSELHPPKSMYADTVSALTTPQDPMMCLWDVCEFIRTMSVSTVSALQNISSLIVIVFSHIYHTPSFCRSTSIIIHHPNSGFLILFRVC